MNINVSSGELARLVNQWNVTHPHHPDLLALNFFFAVNRSSTRSYPFERFGDIGGLKQCLKQGLRDGATASPQVGSENRPFYRFLKLCER